ncbi:hypothetical protein V8E53_015903 [Lactarius tabidus]
MADSEVSTDSAELLATKWWTADAFREHGIQFRKGQFKEAEKVLLETALRGYQETHRLDDDQMEDLVLGTNKQDGFWTHLARAVPGRRLRSVYDYIQRSKHPLRKIRPWTNGDDSQLKTYVDTFSEQGTGWADIGDAMSRPPAACRDRYHKKIAHQGTIKRGRWSSDEDTLLERIMEDLRVAGKTNNTMTNFWVEVSRRIDKTRSAKQCRERWNDVLHHKVQNGGQPLQWELRDSFILVQKIASLDFDCEDSIEWDSLPDDGWNQWSARRLQQKWSALKATVHTPEATHRGKSFENMPPLYWGLISGKLLSSVSLRATPFHIRSSSLSVNTM